MTAERIVDAPAATVFGVLADPTAHHAIDGTGWVRESLDSAKLTTVGQIFRMAMYHRNFGGMHYTVANRVEVFDPPIAIAWLPGEDTDDGTLKFGVGPGATTSSLSPRPHEDHPDIRLVSGAGRHPAAHRLPSVRSSAPGQLAQASGRLGREGFSRGRRFLRVGQVTLRHHLKRRAGPSPPQPLEDLRSVDG